MMLVCGAEYSETMVETEVTDLGAGAGRMRCLECGGDGNWGKFERAGLNFPGPNYKGAGYQLVSV
jgi:hypothetical protein